MPRFRRSRVAPSLAVMLLGALITGGLSATAAAAGDGERTLSGRGALLSAPAEPVTRTLTPVQGCPTLFDSGDGDCAVVRTATGPLVFTVEAGAPVQAGLVSKPWVVRVYRPNPAVPDGWEVALATTPSGGDAGPLFANVTAKIADVTGDGHDELVVGYRSEGTGEFLDVDIVGTTPDGAPKVLAHERLPKATVLVRPGKVVTYAPVYRSHDANCCPTWIRRDVLRFRDGAFVVQAGRRIPTKQADIPPGDLG